MSSLQRSEYKMVALAVGRCGAWATCAQVEPCYCVLHACTPLFYTSLVIAAQQKNVKGLMIVHAGGAALQPAG